MRSEEKRVLLKEKLNEGKGEVIAWKEINCFEGYEKAFKTLWNEKEGLRKELEKIKKEYLEQKESIFKLKFEIDTLKKDERGEVGSLGYIKRILNNMEYDRVYRTKNELAGSLMLSSTDLTTHLDFLMKYGFINVKINYEGIVRMKGGV